MKIKKLYQKGDQYYAELENGDTILLTKEEYYMNQGNSTLRLESGVLYK